MHVSCGIREGMLTSDTFLGCVPTRSGLNFEVLWSFLRTRSQHLCEIDTERTVLYSTVCWKHNRGRELKYILQLVV